jgi:hypothetical protein
LITIDGKRGNQLASTLNELFSTTGIHGNTIMPEDITPKGVKKGSLEHLLFITLTVAIDYQRDANALWANSRKTYEDPATNYLFNLTSLHTTTPATIRNDMQKHGLSKKYHKDAEIWRTVGVTFYKKWQGNPINFLADSAFNALSVLNRLKVDTHLDNGKQRSDYPYLRGPKIGPLWLRMLRDNVGIDKFINLDRVPIPVDIHVARATLSTGIIRGSFSGKLEDLFEEIRKAWFTSVQGLSIKGRSMIALDVDEPLWHLSKNGCTYRNKTTGDCSQFNSCEVKEFCIKGKVYIDYDRVRLDT